MHLIRCCLLAALVCGISCQDTGGEPETTKNPPETTAPSDPKQKEPEELKAEGNLMKTISPNPTTPQPGTGAAAARKLENVTLNYIKPFLLFPREIEKGFNKINNEDKNSSKVDVGPPDGKPFIFLDFAFNIRQTPLKNRTEPFNHSKIIKIGLDDSNKNQKARRRRHSSAKREKAGFFGDLPLFPDSEMEEFFPKPNIFFPDLPFRHNPSQKLKRRKRDQKKSDLNTDFKFFVDAIDEAFMKTQRELEQTDPVLNFLRGAEHSFDEDKKAANDFREKPDLKWTIHRNGKRLGDGPVKTQETPMIIVDKVVKIGEFHVHDDSHDKNKRKKKRDAAGPVRKFLDEGEISIGNPEEKLKSVSKNFFDMIKEQGMKERETNREAEKTFTREESKEMRVPLRTNTTFSSNATLELKHSNSPEHPDGLLEVIDSLKSKVAEGEAPAAERLKRKSDNSKKPLYDDLTRNITEVINRFLVLVKKFDEAKLLERDGAEFDWSEKETLQNAGRNKRQRKHLDFVEEYAESAEKEKPVADLNYLFLNVTLPTVLVIALVLLVCFINLQVKGKICTKLFRPRQLLLIEDDTPPQFTSNHPARTKKPQPI